MGVKYHSSHTYKWVSSVVIKERLNNLELYNDMLNVRDMEGSSTVRKWLNTFQQAAVA